MTESVSTAGSPYRKVLSMAVSVFAQNAGFQRVDGIVLETLTQMLQSFIIETGRSARSFSELGGRTEPLPADVFVALIEMGIDTEKLHEQMAALSSRATPCIVLPIPKQPHPPTNSVINAGEPGSGSDVIPSFFPPLPDPHTYQRTEVNDQPPSDYAAVREAAAVQKRKMENALVEYTLKTHETIQLFPNEALGQIVAPEPELRPYLPALVLCNNLETNDDAMALTQNRDRTNENAFIRTARMPNL